MSLSSSFEDFTSLYRSTQPLDRILSFTFGNDQLSTPFSPPTPPPNTTHFLLVSKTFRDHTLPFFCHSITILRARDWITFFDPGTGIFVVGADVERRKSLVKELRINMYKDARIPINLPDGDRDRKGVARLKRSGEAFSEFREDILLPLDPVVLPNLKHLCLFLTKVPKASKDNHGSGDRQLRAVLEKGIDFENELNSDDDGSIVSDGSFQMDKDIFANLNFERTAFLRSILPPFQSHFSLYISELAPDAPRLDTIRRLGFEDLTNAGRRIEEAYPFPPGLILGEPVPRTLTVYCLPSGKVHDRALGIAPSRSSTRVEPRREDLLPYKVVEAMATVEKTGMRIELVGFSLEMRRYFAEGCRNGKGIDRVFWKERGEIVPSTRKLPSSLTFGSTRPPYNLVLDDERQSDSYTSYSLTTPM
ncbi:hypothetical protein BDY24DRAFT_415217 [Mrakia frigida]|uniref:uncharacterized protein n=1 Tax=Mrakia frigida TaxID=29902 RepID=UPI003FCC0757